MTKLIESDWMPEAKRLAECRDIPVDTNDVRFKLVTYEVIGRFPKCPLCAGRVDKSCKLCGGRGHVKDFTPDKDTVASGEEIILPEAKNKDEFYARVGDKGLAKFLWYETEVSGKLRMPCHDCDVSGLRTDCKFCHGRGYWNRKAKEMKSWCEHNGYECLLEVVSDKDKKPVGVKVKSVRKKKEAK